MTQQRVDGYWLCGQDWIPAECVFNDRVIELKRKNNLDRHSQFIPAPIDLHVHGGGGADVMDGEQAVRTVLRTHLHNGTSALLATSVTAPFADIDRFIEHVSSVMSEPRAGEAELLGIHLEGPFISPEKLGAQPNYPASLHMKQLERWFASGLVKVLTYAPELDPATQVPDLCKVYGVKAQLGHTLCSWSEAKKVLTQQVGVTHLYNAMGAVHHRQGGAATAALAYADFAEIITDGLHVDEAAFHAAKRAIKNLYSVTDATAAAAMPDGTYQLGSLKVYKSGAKVSLPDGTLAGSCLTMQHAFKVLLSWGLKWEEIASMTSQLPARWLDLHQHGVIASGAWASWIELHDSHAVAIWHKGQRHLLEGIT